MRRLILLSFVALAFSANVFGHTAFTLVSIEKKTIKDADITRLQKDQSIGTKDGINLTYTDREVRLIAVTGPEDDMLSYRIQGVRNPNLVVPPGATLRILFVNTDVDMRHDIRFGHVVGEFPIAPEIAETVGSTKLVARAADGTFHAEEMVLKASQNGAYKYFCSVRGHAKGGMWGNILVGVKPGADLKAAEKIPHVHSADEEKDHDHPATPAATPAKPGQAAPSKANEHDHHSTPAAKPTTTPTPGHEHHGATPAAPGAEHSGHSAGMSSNINIGEPMSREGSGTAWIPDSSPMYAWMKMYEDGSHLMVHGSAFVRYTSIGSSRDVSVAGKGDRSRFDAPTMFMAMYTKPIGTKSQIGIRTMFSLDPIIERGYGYPLLYQSGELYRDEPIHDRQHPHDAISELAATYSYKFNDKSSFYVYGGLPGEPALGPTMYLHRPSGANNPDAPIGHHWQDASHITYGVLTAGYTYDKVKFEVSAFNGTEPDENRWGFDKPRLNSFSGRFSINPTKNWSLQISHGYLRNPERSEPELKVLRRTTASAMYNKSFSEDRNWASSFVWGQNHTDEDGRTNAFLFESNYEFGKNSVFGRAEQVQKNSHELVLPHPHPEGNFWVQAYSLGYVRDIVKNKGVDVGLGGTATLNFNPESISNFYGGTRHGGWSLFVRFRPSRSAH